MNKYTRYLVCYDIPDNKLRKQFSDSLKDIGLIALQKSVFYGDLNFPEAKELARLAHRLLNSDTDKCFWFPCFLPIEEIKKCVGYENFEYEEPDGFKFL